MPKEETLKAFIVTYYVDNEDNPRSCVIISHDKKEAGDIFVKWLHATARYDHVTGLVVQRTRKTKRNAHMITKAFYERQNNFVEQLAQKHGKVEA